jgi:high-affinity iron transporter
MLAGFIIMFRETLEAALIVGIILSFLVKTDQKVYFKTVIFGSVTGIALSIVIAYLFKMFAGGFSGRNEELFEGITMLFGAFLLTTMILWMMKQRNIARDIEKRVLTSISRTRKIGLFFLVFISIVREGVESVIFLAAARFASAENNLIGAMLGVAAAIVLGYIIFISSLNFNVKSFFALTGVILILFAAGLVAHGIHELQEAHIVPQLVEHLWDINPAVGPDGSVPLFHENGYIGSILKGLFGYNGNPSLLEVIGYLVYIGVIVSVYGRKKTQTLQYATQTP